MDELENPITQEAEQSLSRRNRIAAKIAPYLAGLSLVGVGLHNPDTANAELLAHSQAADAVAVHKETTPRVHNKITASTRETAKPGFIKLEKTPGYNTYVSKEAKVKAVNSTLALLTGDPAGEICTMKKIIYDGQLYGLTATHCLRQSTKSLLGAEDVAGWYNGIFTIPGHDALDVSHVLDVDNHQPIKYTVADPRLPYFIGNNGREKHPLGEITDGFTVDTTGTKDVALAWISRLDVQANGPTKARSFDQIDAVDYTNTGTSTPMLGQRVVETSIPLHTQIKSDPYFKPVTTEGYYLGSATTNGQTVQYVGREIKGFTKAGIREDAVGVEGASGATFVWNKDDKIMGSGPASSSYQVTGGNYKELREQLKIKVDLSRIGFVDVFTMVDKRTLENLIAAKGVFPGNYIPGNSPQSASTPIATPASHR